MQKNNFEIIDEIIDNKISNNALINAHSDIRLFGASDSEKQSMIDMYNDDKLKTMDSWESEYNIDFSNEDWEYYVERMVDAEYFYSQHNFGYIDDDVYIDEIEIDRNNKTIDCRVEFRYNKIDDSDIDLSEIKKYIESEMFVKIKDIRLSRYDKHNLSVIATYECESV